MVFIPRVGFTSGLGVISVFMMLFFFAVIGLISAMIIRNIYYSMTTSRDNHASLVLIVPAAIVSKRMGGSVHNYQMHGNNGYYNGSQSEYFVTFEVESGDRMELRVDQALYGLMAEDDVGRLTFQGTRFINFERTRRMM